MTPDDQPWPDADDEHAAGASKVAGAARAAGRGAAATGRGIAATGRGMGRFGRYAFVQARRAADAQGADRSGLSRLLEMHAFN
ncbi:MAG: MFS transporter, partial [Nocardioides sp.]